MVHSVRIEPSNDPKSLHALMLITDGFPYGKGEKPFVIPEIEALRSLYQITIVSMASDDAVADIENVTPLPADITLIRVKPTRTAALLGCLRMPFSKEGRREIGEICASASSFPLRLKRIAESAWQYGLAWSAKRSFEKLRLFDDVDCTLYYTFWLNHCNLALALEKDAFPNLALVSRIHGYDLYDERAHYGRQPFQWLKLAACDKIVFAAQAAQDYFVGKHALDEMTVKQKLALSRIGSKVSAYPNESQISHEKPLIVSCSNAIPLKRIDLMIEALSLLKDLDITWIHFGDGPELASLKALAQERGLNARFEGYKNNNELMDFYARNPIDLFITTTSTEGGCPVSITEALAFGIPIIGTNVGGIPEQVDGNGILLAEDPTPKEVADAIAAMLTQSLDEANRMRARSRELFERRFDADANLAVLVDALDAAQKS